MHSAIVGGCFLLILIVPCLVAMHSSSQQGRSGNTGAHNVASATTVAKANRPSRVRMAADAAFGKDNKAVAPDQRPSRLHRVAKALVYREAYVPMDGRDPGAPKHSIRELRAKQAAAKSARS